jgi:CubicO group peptidase (beta-lactamase class C family)
VAQLYAFLNGHALARDIGARYEYSNLGVGLLGHALAQRCGTTYEQLVLQRITGPLGMQSTAVTLSPDLKTRLAHGHDEDGRPVPNWDLMEATAGAGALRSTANDLLTFLAVALGYDDHPLKPAIDAQLAFPMREAEEAERHPLQRPEDRTSIGLGWHALDTELGRVVMHGGGTGGYLTFMGLNPARGCGAVVLTNMFKTPGAIIGVPLLTGAPLPPAPKWRPAHAIDPTILDRYVGRYRFAPGAGPGWIQIARWGDGLAANVEGMGEAPIYAASATTFFWRVADAELTFETDADGAAAVALVTRTRGLGENRAERE